MHYQHQHLFLNKRHAIARRRSAISGELVFVRIASSQVCFITYCANCCDKSSLICPLMLSVRCHFSIFMVAGHSVLVVTLFLAEFRLQTTGPYAGIGIITVWLPDSLTLRLIIAGLFKVLTALVTYRRRASWVARCHYLLNESSSVASVSLKSTSDAYPTTNTKKF